MARERLTHRIVLDHTGVFTEHNAKDACAAFFQEVKQWCDDILQGEYDSWYAQNRNTVSVWYFTIANDAMLFKLRYGGEYYDFNRA